MTFIYFIICISALFNTLIHVIFTQLFDVIKDIYLSSNYFYIYIFLCFLKQHKAQYNSICTQFFFIIND